ncbi:MAG: Ig-like domain-containing protein, partial [Actinomycetota bacterium]
MRRRIVRRPRLGSLIGAAMLAVVLVAAQVVSAGAQTTPVTVAVTSSLNPSTFGQSVTFNASVSALGGLLGQGTVQFQVDGANVGGAETVTILSGSASYSTSALGAGSHTVTANYTSTGGNGSGSLAGGQVVKKAATTLTLTSSANPAPVGSSVILTATVAVTAPGGGSPDGSVSFVTGNASLGTVAIGGGKAYLTVYPDTLPGGTDSITAAYAGSSNYSGSSSSLSETVAGTGPG